MDLFVITYVFQINHIEDVKQVSAHGITEYNKNVQLQKVSMHQCSLYLNPSQMVPCFQIQ